MIFRYRPAQVQDLAHCVPQARDAFSYSASDYNDIQAMWIDLLTTGRTVSMVIEEIDTRQIVFFAMMVFVTDAFAARLAAGNVPPICSGYLLDAWRAGTTPFPTREEIRTANSTTGVNLLCITSGIALDIIAAGKLPFLLSKINDCHPFSFAGYKLNSIYVELYDTITCAWGDTFGYNRIQNYANYYTDRGGIPASYGANYPHLYGVTKEEAVLKFGSVVTTFFHYTPPRFGFTASEQEMLLWALSGDPDQYLSENLCVAPVTIRKRWSAIYNRVAAVLPDFFGAIMTIDTGKRGSEKKRRLLAYLEHHMEELRPYRPSLLSAPT